MKSALFFITFCFIGVLSAGEIDYHRDVAPILRDYCGGCHNESDYDGDFSIETYQSLLAGGESKKVMITPGDVAKSFFASTILRVTKPAMPPQKEPQPTEAEIAILTKWIEEGARGPAPEDDHSILATLNVPKITATGKAPQPITAAEYSPDGSQFALGRYGRVEIGDHQDTDAPGQGPGGVIKVVIPVDGKVNEVHFSPDGKRLIISTGITGLKGIATVHDTTNGKELLRLGEGAHRDILYDAEFSPDGKLIATTGYDRSIQIWNAETGEFIRKIEGHNGAIFDIAFSPDNTLIASASADETGKIWRVSDGERLDTLNQPEGEQFRISFTPDGKYILATGGDKKIRLWRLQSQTKAQINPVIHTRFAHEESVNEMAMSSDGKWLATTASDHFIKLWSLPQLTQVKSMANQSDLVSVLAFGPGNTLFAGRMDSSTEAYPIGDLKIKKTDSIVLNGPLNSIESRLNSIESKKEVETFKPFTESETEILPIEWPAEISGSISDPIDTDDYLFSAKKGETVVIEVKASRAKSMLDSKIEVLTANGDRIERVVLQAVRDSWFTFRGKDSDTSDDFRVHNWEEMELNEYLYADGEVVKLWHYPRGPDSGFRVYPGFGNRATYFDTTPLTHPLGGPCYTVVAYPPGSELSPNGLPIYRIHWENDDDGARNLGSDSRLTFVAPEDGSYRVRISDVRGFGGEKYSYKMTLRSPKPAFTFKDNSQKLKVSPGSGKEIEFVASRIDGFDGEIKIQLENLPPGLTAHPVTIEPEQRRAYMVIYAAEDLVIPPAEEIKKIKAVATAVIAGESVVKSIPTLSDLGLSGSPKLKVDIHPDGENGKTGPDGILEITVKSGQTVSALVKAERKDFKDLVTFGTDDSGRNLPHGVYVDNIGLSGLMIPAGQDVQRLWITAAKWVPETERLFHLHTKADGGHTTRPVRVRVVN